MPQQKGKYAHGEAFALMWYACPCGHRERIWNTRDGVTPFGGLLCASCGQAGLDGGLQHVWFTADSCQPDHKLNDGQLFFRDGTAADAVSIIEKRFRIFASRGQAVPQDVQLRMIADARNQTGEWQPGWPMTERYDWTDKDQVERYKGTVRP